MADATLMTASEIRSNGSAALNAALGPAAALRFFKLLKDLGVAGQPVGAEELQRMMAQEDLEPNELSRGIIEMRDA